MPGNDAIVNDKFDATGVCKTTNSNGDDIILYTGRKRKRDSSVFSYLASIDDEEYCL